MINLKDICKVFNKYNINYLIIGGDAAAYYGVNRVSLDYDIWIEPDKKHFKKVIDALDELGYLENKDKIAIGSKLYHRWELLNKFKLNRFISSNNKPIDIFSHNIKYKKFSSCYKRKNTIIIDNINYNYISLKDLIELKKQAGRKKDLNDIEDLKD